MIWTRPLHPKEAPQVALQEILGNLATGPAATGHRINRVIHRWEGGFRSWTAQIGPGGRGSRPDLIVKFILAGEDQAHRVHKAQREYHNLTLAYGLFSHAPGMTVPRPIDFYDSHAAMVMSFCKGPSLARYLTRISFAYSTSGRRQYCEQLAVYCAQWLQAIRNLRAAAMDVQDAFNSYVKGLSARLRQCGTRGYLKQASLRKLAERYVDVQYPSGEPGMAVGTSHHDFGPHNMLVSDDGIAVIDFGDVQLDLQAHDVSRLWIELTLLAHSRAMAKDRAFILRDYPDTGIGENGVNVEDCGVAFPCRPWSELECDSPRRLESRTPRT